MPSPEWPIPVLSANPATPAIPATTGPQAKEVVILLEPRPTQHLSPLTLEVDHGSASSWGRTPDNDWVIRLRRAERSVVLAVGLRHTAADHLADHVADVVGCPHNATEPVTTTQPHPELFAESDITQLVAILDFFARWLNTDIDYARDRLPLYGIYTVDDLLTDTIRLTKAVKAAQLGP